MKRKTNLQSCAVIALLLVVTVWSGCSSGNKATVSRDVLRIGTTQRVKSENILYDHVLDTFVMISHPPLFILDSQGKCHGLLVERFTVSDDFTQWTLYIKNDYVWSDGVAVTPEDIVFSFQYISGHVPSKKWLDNVLVSATVQTEKAVVLTFSRPYTHLDIELTTFPIIPRHIWKGVQQPRYYSGSSQYTGCGPFVIHRIDSTNGFIALERNPFWKGVQPSLNRIEIHMYQNVDVLSLALERGDIDTFYKYAGTYPYSNLERLMAMEKFRFEREKTFGLTMLGFNLKREPMSNVHFRQAIAQAIDYDEVRKLITLDYGNIPDPGFIPGCMGGVKTLPQFKQDLTAAQKLLANAGYRDLNRDGALETPDGEAFNLLLLSTPAHQRLCQLIAGYLDRLGVKVEVRMVETATWISMKDSYDYDIVLARTTPWGMLMHAGWGTGYFDSRRTGEGVLHTVSDPVFLNLCDAALATRDPEKLETYARSFQDYFSQHLPAIAIIQQVNVTPYHNSFSNWHQDPLFGIYNLTNFLHLKRTDERE